LTRTYFKILDQASLEDVLTAAKVCLSNSKTFPKPVDWLNALPVAISQTAAGDCRVMPATELADYVRAEALHYEDLPCSCLTCQAAACTDRPLRFVPDFRADGTTEHAIDTVRNRRLVVGHWAHGEELVAWYTARDAFYAVLPRTSPGMRRGILRLLARRREGTAVAAREPGEEG